MSFAALLDSYCNRGGKDLGEFLMGSQGRMSVNPPPQPTQFLGDFDGVMQKVGGKFPRLCEALGGMKGSSLKRMIGENHIANGEVVAKMAEALGIAAGSREDAKLWHLARGDKTLPDIEEIMERACKAMQCKGAEPTAVAREMGLRLFERSGYTYEKFGALSGRVGMIKEMTRNDGYAFLPDRSEGFSRAILPGEEPDKIDKLEQLLLGQAVQKRVGTLAEQVRGGDITFGQLIKSIRAERKQTQRAFAQDFTDYVVRAAVVTPPPTITQSMVDKWEHDKVPLTSRALATALGRFVGLKHGDYELVPCGDKGILLEQSTRGLDPDSYRKLIDASSLYLENVNPNELLKITQDIRFEPHDPVVERWWRGMAAEHRTDHVKVHGVEHSSLTAAWNDLHDLLFGHVDAARMKSPVFKDHVEMVVSYIAKRRDKGTSRKVILGTIARQICEQNDSEQCKSLAHLACAANMEHVQGWIAHQSRKYNVPIDTDDVWGEARSKLFDIFVEKRFKELGSMNSFIDTMVMRKVIDVRRKSQRHATVPLKVGDLGEREEASVAPVEAFELEERRDLLELMKKHLNVLDLELFEAVSACEPGEIGITKRVAAYMGRPEGTVKSGLNRLRHKLVAVPEICERAGDLLGDSFGEGLKRRSQHHADDEGYGSRG